MEACERNYRSHPNVLGVGYGLKFRKGKRTGDALCIHFYVRRKVKRVAKRLPRFVYARTARGAMDRRVRIPTDVIALENRRFTCRSGDPIDTLGETGTITLVFRSRSAARPGFFLVTCAHVAGDVSQSPPVDPRIQGACCRRQGPLALTLGNSVARGGTVDYDVALAELTPQCTPQPDRRVVGAATRLASFRERADIHPGDTLSCAFPVSNTVSALVSSGPTTIPLFLDGVEYDVRNLFLIDGWPQPGDSGGLLYDASEAVGILVGRADGWGFFQPLGEAFAYLVGELGIDVRCF